MPVFPRAARALPRLATPPDFPAGLSNWGQSGKGQFRAVQNMGRTWEEVYPLLDTANASVRALLEAINRSKRAGGLVWQVQHPYWHRRHGVGGGAPLTHSPAQLQPDPENFGVWSVSGTPTRTGGQSDPYGGVAAYVVDDNDAGNFETVFQTVTFTADGEKAFSIFVRQGTSANAWFRIRDTTAGTDRHLVGIAWSGGTPTLSTLAGSGTLFTPEFFGSGWWRCSATANSVVATNGNSFEYAPASFAVGGTGTTFFFGANAWNSNVYGPYRGPSNPGPSGFPLTQEGDRIFVRGAPVSTTGWLLAGDLIDLPGSPVVLDVVEQVDTNAEGGAQIVISPPLFSGAFIADGVAVTTDPSLIFFDAVIASIEQFPAMDSTRYIDPGLTITWREQPA